MFIVFDRERGSNKTLKQNNIYLIVLKINFEPFVDDYLKLLLLNTFAIITIYNQLFIH